ncbi:hypothetical protein QJS04_geneDACA002436 [Acorus gramineus]|uniref:Uncharacterized protein n=1 Tax=Acorus gramineus TaxID=55184 RepID=A0AAV9A8Z0_ACOGR|nr:hypothetical protein QJS04_geneDACA002436 [Acorus gramineus]
MRLMMPSPKLFFICLYGWSLSIVHARDESTRPTHGLAYQNPMAFSPAAFEFFHPDMPATKGSSSSNIPCKSNDCSPSSSQLSTFPRMAAKAQATQVHETAWSLPGVKRGSVGVDWMVGIMCGITFIVLVAMGAYYVMIKHRENINCSNSCSGV